METLLNKLIEKGWKPFNRKKTLHIICYDKCKGINYKWIHLDGGFMNEESRTLRELVSIESGLWQFCTENGMIKEEQNVFENYGKDKYEYWLCKCALKNEDELEDFLLNNIKIEG